MVSRMNDAEIEICKMYLEDLDKTHTSNEYKLLMKMLDKRASRMSEWIPVSERLPEECGYYLISTHGGGVVESFFDKREFWYERANCIWTKAKAWMPLPEPYTEGGTQYD
jgi:hypothetical protein